MIRTANDTIRRGFFIYPWDLIDPKPVETLTRMKTEFNCNALIVSGNYHHARLLRPRADGPKTVHYPGALAAFQPVKNQYQDENMMPVPAPDLVRKDVLRKTREAAQSQGLDFGLWLVGLHNSTLGEKNPEYCLENCFGDHYTYSLCPGQTPSRDYLTGMVNDVCQQFRPDRMILEAAGTLGLHHGLHHELFLTEWDQALEFLFSICFCPACRKDGVENGIAVEALRDEIRRLAGVLLDQERGRYSPEFRMEDTASLLVEVKDLFEYIRLGSTQVTSLVRQISETAKQHDCVLEVIPASFHRPSSQAWLERAMLGELARYSDRLLIPAYFPGAGEVKADLDWVRTLVPDVQLSAGLNVCSPMPGPGALLSQVQACLGTGSQAVYYYNYGLLNRTRLEWVKEVNQTLFSERSEP